MPDHMAMVLREIRELSDATRGPCPLSRQPHLGVCTPANPFLPRGFRTICQNLLSLTTCAWPSLKQDGANQNEYSTAL